MAQTGQPRVDVEPIHKAHAIAEMAVILEFAPTVELAPSPWVNATPQLFGSDFTVEVAPVHQFNVTPSGMSTSAQIAYLVRKGGTSASPAWLLRIEPATVAVHCFSYSRWDHVWKEARSYLDLLMPHLASASQRLATIGLRYVDQFNFKSGPENFDPSKLLRPNKHLHAGAFDSGTRWHCHTGWFDEQPGPEVLHQLNINSVVPTPGGPTADPLIAVDHVQLIRQQPGATLPPYLHSSAQGKLLDDLMQRLHDSNKVVMLELLQPAIAKRINLSAKKGGGT